MNDNVENVLSMMIGLSLQLHEDGTIWAGNQLVGQFVQQLDGSIAFIHSQEQALLLGDTAPTEEKDLALIPLLPAVEHVREGVLSYARFTGNTTYLRLSSKSKSAVKKLRDTTLYNYGAALVASATAIGDTDLSKHNVKAAEVTNLATLNNAYLLTIQKKVPASGKTRTARLAIAKEEIKTKAMLRLQLDPLIETFDLADHDFVERYKSARIVHHLGIRHEDDHCGIEFNLLHFETEAIENNVTIDVVNTGETFTSTPDDKTLITEKVKGNYIFRFSKPGFKTQEDDFDLNKNETLSIDILMEPDDPETPPETPTP